MADQSILTWIEKGVGVVQLNRPQALNALNREMMADVIAALEQFDGDREVGCLLVTGNERAFAAGADIKQMAQAQPVDMLDNPFIDYWDRLQRLHKPLIAAVSGFALGGGCEFAMACDMIIASDSAQFGQPEINLGVIPGAGGTQRLTRAVGKAIAMEMVLNDRRLNADEALHFGLVNRVVPRETYLQEAIAFGAQIAARAPVAMRLAKEAINGAFEMPLQASLAHERRLFYLLFSTLDQKEGMQAFTEKRAAEWQGK